MSNNPMKLTKNAGSMAQPCAAVDRGAENFMKA